MRSYTRITGLLAGWLLVITAYAQQTAEEVNLMRSTLNETRLLTVQGDTVGYPDITANNSLVALFFCFNGCTGCKISVKETLIPNYEILRERYGLELIVISKEEGNGRVRAAEEYSGYPFRLFFDIDNKLFTAMPPGVYNDGRVMKAWPLLVLVDSEFHFLSVNPFSFELIEKGARVIRDSGTE